MANELISIERLENFHDDMTVDAHILKRSTAYAVDNIVNKGLVYLKCTQAGTTASTALSLSGISVGDTLTDGGAKWEVISVNGVPAGGGTASGIAIWATNKTYKVNDMVLYEDVMYKCNTQHTSTIFSADSSNWDFVYNNIQDWSATTFYKQGATVIYNHKLYQCVTEHTSTSTWDESKWQLIGDVSGAGLEDWESNHDYAVDDIYVYEGEIYKTLVKFTSGATEDSRTKVNDVVPSVWTANTAYTAGDIIEHTDVTTLKNVYYNVTDNFTSGATFEVTAEMQEIQIVEEYVPNPLTKQQVKNLIRNFVPSGSGTDPIFYNDSPIGTIIAYMGITAPKDYLACDGTIYNIVDYKELAEYIKIQFGSYNYFGGDGTTTFAVPDLRGEFLRGTGTNSHVNQGSGANVGTHQDATEIPNFGTANENDNFNFMLQKVDSVSYARNVDYSITGSAKNASAPSTWSDSVSDKGIRSSVRPTNTSVLYCIKYNTSVLSTPENNYSTEEQRIGTWIDGKPLYQKTYNITSPSTDTDNAIVTLDPNIFPINWDGYLIFSTGSPIGINLYYTDSQFINTYPELVSGTIHMKAVGANYHNLSGYITLKYTKTTD